MGDDVSQGVLGRDRVLAEKLPDSIEGSIYFSQPFVPEPMVTVCVSGARFQRH